MKLLVKPHVAVIRDQKSTPQTISIARRFVRSTKRPIGSAATL